jgi:hypothetical protein
MGRRKIANGLRRELNVRADLALDFFLAFSRFEFALKRAGFVRGDAKQALADWEKFAKALREVDTSAVLKCCTYLSANPPKKQVLDDGKLNWALRNRNLTEIDNILLDVRTIRNNVLHGGKYKSGPMEEPLRDQRLIKDCLGALKALLDLPSLPEGVRENFRPTN